MALFLSAAQMEEVVSALLPHYGADAPVVVAHRVSRPDEKILRCSLGEVAAKMAEAEITLTALILVGPMLDDAPGAESHLYSAAYSHTFRKARADGSGRPGGPHDG